MSTEVNQSKPKRKSYDWRTLKGAYGAYYCACGKMYNGRDGMRDHFKQSSTCAEKHGYKP